VGACRAAAGRLRVCRSIERLLGTRRGPAGGSHQFAATRRTNPIPCGTESAGTRLPPPDSPPLGLSASRYRSQPLHDTHPRRRTRNRAHRFRRLAHGARPVCSWPDTQGPGRLRVERASGGVPPAAKLASLAVDVQRATAPYLYKYRSCADRSRLESILLDHELYFSAPQDFDDDKEAKPRIVASSDSAYAGCLFNVWMRNHPGRSPAELASEFAKIRDGMALVPPAEGLKAIAEGLHLTFNDYRILSLSTRFDIEDCWMRYADEHRGCCLEFDNSGPLFGRAMTVAYGDEVKIDIAHPDQVSDTFLYRKTTIWRAQREARIVQFPRGGPHVHRFEPRLLRRVILGKDISLENRAAVLEIVGRREMPTEVVAR
jgi:hypothetical protein